MINRSQLQRGFAAVEGLLIVVAIGLIVGVGVYVTKQRSDKQAKTDPTSSAQLDPNKIGTVAGVDEANSFELDEELKAGAELESQEAADAQADMEAVSQTGEGYEVSF